MCLLDVLGTLWEGEILSLTHSSDTTHLSDTSNISLISYSIIAKLKKRHMVLFLNMLQVFSET